MGKIKTKQQGCDKTSSLQFAYVTFKQLCGDKYTARESGTEIQLKGRTK